MLRQNGSNQGTPAMSDTDMALLRTAYQAATEARRTTGLQSSFSSEKAFRLFMSVNAAETSKQPASPAIPMPKAASGLLSGMADTDAPEFNFPTLPATELPVVNSAAIASPVLNNQMTPPAPFQPLPDTTPQEDTDSPAVFNQLHHDSDLHADQLSLMFDDADTMSLELPPPPESWLLRAFNNPKKAMLIVGLSVLASAVYATLGFWWLTAKPVKPAPDAMSMMALQEDPSASSPTPVKKMSLKNIQAIQEQSAVSKPVPPAPKTPAEIAVEPPDSPTVLLAQAIPAVSAPIKGLPELTGRPDPFAPLIQVDTGDSSSNTPLSSALPSKKDVLADIQYTGFIGSVNAKHKLAIIKTPGNRTVIKKVGDAFVVDDERVVLKGITKQALQLSISGEKRTLAIAPYQDAVATSSVSAASTAPASAAPAKSADAQLQEP